MDSATIKVFVRGGWHYWAEAWSIARVLAVVEQAVAQGYRVWVQWPSDTTAEQWALVSAAADAETPAPFLPSA